MKTVDDLPPTVSGDRPLIGHSLQFMRDPAAVIERGHREHGNAFTLNVGFRPMVVLAGPEHARTVFEQTDEGLSISGGMAFLGSQLGEDFYFLAPADEYRRQREVVLPRFQSRQLDGYLEVMDAEAAEFVRQLGSRGEFDLARALGPVVMRIAAGCFLGRSFIDRIDGDFFAAFRRFTAGIDPVLPGWLPLPHHVRGRQAREWLRAQVRRTIADRRAHPADPPDFLQELMTARYSDGTPMPEHLRVNMALAFIMAGYETTTGHLAWSLIDLLRHPAELDKIRAEQREALPGHGPLTMPAVSRLACLTRALHETQRLHPSFFLVFRTVTRDTQAAGYRLPAGSRAALSVAVTHRLPGLFNSPDSYRPSRFADDPKLAHRLIGFGGGMHRCLGMHFAYLEMKVVLTRLLQAFDLELATTDPRPIRGPRTPWPQSPCLVRYRPRRTEAASGG